ncbi:MAG TPA: glycosyltransferase [Nitrospinota bacterium]|nr:glycosyltransferase [Nitrospinota bacterium]
MIKILHVITNLAVGGAETFLYNLATSMDKSSFDNRIVSLMHKEEIGDWLEKKGIPVTSLGMKRGIAGPLSLLRLAAIIRRENPDIIQTWLYHSDLMATVAILLSRTQGQLVWNIRCSNLVGDNRNKQLFWLRKLLCIISNKPHTVIVNSVAGKEFHHNFGYRPKRWKIVNNGFDFNKFRPKADARDYIDETFCIEKDKFLIGLIGRFDPVKGIFNFIQSAGMVSKLIPNARFILIGDGMDSRNSHLNKWLNECYVKNIFTLAGKRDDISLIMPGLDVLASCSISEGFPNTIGEAMSCAVLCVATDVGDSSALIGDCGIIVPPGDTKKMAEAIRDAHLMDNKTKVKLGKAARVRIKENYSLDESIANYQSIYQSIVEG